MYIDRDADRKVKSMVGPSLAIPTFPSKGTFYDLLAKVNPRPVTATKFPGARPQLLGGVILLGRQNIERTSRLSVPRESLTFTSFYFLVRPRWGTGTANQSLRTVLPGSVTTPGPSFIVPKSQCKSSTRAGKSPPRTSTPTCKPAHASPPPRLRNDRFHTGIPETPTANVSQNPHARRRSRHHQLKNCSSRPLIVTETRILSISRPKNSSDSPTSPP